MERRVTSHTEEEEMNQRRRLLALARKGDEKAISRLMELYQVRVFSGDKLRSLKSVKSLSPETYGETRSPRRPSQDRKKMWRAPHASRTVHTSRPKQLARKK